MESKAARRRDEVARQRQYKKSKKGIKTVM